MILRENEIDKKKSMEHNIKKSPCENYIEPTIKWLQL